MPSLVDYKAIILGSIILAAFNFLVTQSLSDDVAKLHVYFFRSVFFYMSVFVLQLVNINLFYYTGIWFP